MGVLVELRNQGDRGVGTEIEPLREILMFVYLKNLGASHS